MENEAKIVLAFLFKRSGKKKLSASDLYLPLSLELKWLSTTEAKEFVERALSEKLLKKTKEGLSLTFDPSPIDVPFGFRPAKESLLKTKSIPASKDTLPSEFSLLVKRIASHTRKSTENIEQDIHQYASEMRVLPVVAALYIAARSKVKIDDLVDNVEQALLTKNAE